MATAVITDAIVFIFPPLPTRMAGGDAANCMRRVAGQTSHDRVIFQCCNEMA
jgi:hypothetical protein